MKKYKLLKWYPSLPKNVKEGIIVQYYEAIEGYSDHNLEIVSKLNLADYEVEDNPEYWQEIVEINYEIIGFTDGYNDYFKSKESDFFTINTVHYYTFDELRNRSAVKISKVKRLSDNKVFCLEGKAKSINGHSEHIIKSFEIQQKAVKRNEDGSYEYDGVDRIWVNWNEKLGGNWLEEIEPHIPLFTTVDGEEIYKLDEFYVVNNKHFKLHKTFGGNYQADKWKNFRFAEKENAEEYILMNKPCLSLLDVADHFGDNGKMQFTNDTTRRFFEHLKLWTKNNRLDV